MRRDNHQPPHIFTVWPSFKSCVFVIRQDMSNISDSEVRRIRSILQLHLFTFYSALPPFYSILQEGYKFKDLISIRNCVLLTFTSDWTGVGATVFLAWSYPPPTFSSSLFWSCRENYKIQSIKFRIIEFTDLSGRQSEDTLQLAVHQLVLICILPLKIEMSNSSLINW